MDRAQAAALAQALVDEMTLEEAASQLRFDAPAISRLNVPEYNWWNEGLHGVARAGTATMFPQAIALAATFDTALLREVGEVVATEGRAKYNESRRHGDRDIYKGLTYWSPNVNIFRDPRWGRGHETYGEDPFLTAELGIPFIHGLQGEDDGVPYLKLAACAKHYAVHSGPEGERHSFDARPTPKDLWETYLPAFERCVRDGRVESVMGAYNRVNGEPCCAHKVLLGDILRGQWGFEGHVVSDCWAIRDFHEHHHVTKTMEESAALALQNGCDLNCGCAYQQIMRAYAYGEITEQDIRRAAVRLFTTRYLLGMFEKTPYDDIPYEVVECPEHLAIARRATEESLVLLKNDGILPLDTSKVRTIGVIGPNADSRTALIGNYYGTSSRYITVLEGIQDLVGDDARILYSKGCDLSDPKPDPLSRPYHQLSEAATVCDHSDVVILCLGLNEHLEGEEGDEGNHYASGDKRDLALPATQQALLKVVEQSGKPYVLCVLSGSALDLTRPAETASAILQVFYPGARGGTTVADVLFGHVSPSGKLPVTFYRGLEDMPPFTDYTLQGRTYRYVTTPPLYPFGYGLTYGQAVVEDAACGTQTFAEAAKSGAEVTATVANFSGRALCEVLQVYVRVEGTPDETPNPRLCGFVRVPLGPGERRSVSVRIPAAAFETVAQDGARGVTGSAATLFVGFGQPDERTRELTGQECLTLALR